MTRRLGVKLILCNMGVATALLLAIFAAVLIAARTDQQRELKSRIEELSKAPEKLELLDENDILRRFCIIVTVTDDGRITDRLGDYQGFDDEEQLKALIDTVLSSDDDEGLLRRSEVRYSRLKQGEGYRIVLAGTEPQRILAGQLFVRVGKIFIFAGLVLLILNLAFIRFALQPAKTSWAMQKDFSANVSHELKTPLTVIMTNAELLRSDGQSAENKARCAENIYLEAKQMRELIENMLDLARADSDTMRGLFTKFELGTLVEDVLMPFEPLFYEAGLELVTDIDSGIKINGSRHDMAHAITVLLDNALKYSLPDAPVRVSLAPHGLLHCRLSVSGCGEALSQKELADIFKRFYRTENSKKVGHSYGLGLPIARLIVQRHRGLLWAESKEHINTFIIQLPRKR